MNYLKFLYKVKASIKTNSKSRHVNFFLYGSFFSLIGDTLGFLILNWFVMSTFGSERFLAIFNFIRLLPIPIMCCLSGYLADTYSKKKLLIISYLGMIFFNFIIFFYFSFPKNEFILLCCIVFLRGLFAEMEPSLRYAIIPDIVEENEVIQTTSTYTTLLNCSAIIAPSLLAIFIRSRALEQVAFLYIPISLVVVLFSVTKIKESPSSMQKIKLKTQIVQVKKYLFVENKKLLLVLLSSYAFMFFISSFNTLTPAFAQNFLHYSKNQYSFIMTTCAIGAIFGSFLVRYLRKYLSLHLIFISGVFSSMILFFTTITTNIYIIFVVFLFLGGAVQATRTLNRIYVQTQAPVAIRGKLLALSLLDRAFIPFGALSVGFLTYAFPIQVNFEIFAVIALLIYVSLLLIIRHKEKRMLYAYHT